MPAVETAAEIGFNIASAIISLGTTLGPVGAATLGVGLKAAETTAVVPGALMTVKDVVAAAGELTRLKSGVKQGFVRGNPQQILQNITQGATKLANGAFRLADGTIVRLANSSRGGGPTLYINKAGQLFKIRVQ